ncbi:uncharacterized protein CEXT_424431 [Caerostris extrusa]|uniref:Uncharacterized protein n=1 Tax=Caerostris extrusa TaxID=172846 RepID=A0AAV4SHQ5_CAEEX|nr:uncharacterized protein CEXT_424431 [Caerostris extrusa]
MKTFRDIFLAVLGLLEIQLACTLAEDGDIPDLGERFYHPSYILVKDNSRQDEIPFANHLSEEDDNESEDEITNWRHQLNEKEGLARRGDSEKSEDLARNEDLVKNVDLARNEDSVKREDLARKEDLVKRGDLARNEDLAKNVDLARNEVWRKRGFAKREDLEKERIWRETFPCRITSTQQ